MARRACLENKWGYYKRFQTLEEAKEFRDETIELHKNYTTKEIVG
jgi:viroplasmin and RNaseH domain-containing protein